MPYALLTGRIRVRIVGAEHLAVRRADLVFAASLLAVVRVLVQRKAVVTSAHVRADRVTALLLTAAIVHGTLVLVCVSAKSLFEVSDYCQGACNSFTGLITTSKSFTIN